ncbi:MAG: hypothetical protein ACYDC2_05060 [Solirubrobacteraceae bacterium]
MKAKLALLATLAACCGSLVALTPAAGAAKPNLCETGCGGKWGAKEHARDYAEKHGFIDVFVNGCWQTSSYGAQWACSGGGQHGGSKNFTVWMDAYGYEKHWEEFIG